MRTIMDLSAVAAKQCSSMRTVVGLFCASLLLASSLALSAERGAVPKQPRAVELMPGQRATLLPDGNTLITGLSGGVLKANGAAIQDAETGKVTALPNGLNRQRAFHSATVLPDGTVLLLGGTDRSGNIVEIAERFDPTSQSFQTLESTGLMPRTQHSATVLTDGTVLVAGGRGVNGTFIPDAELWNPNAETADPIRARLTAPRVDAAVTLEADGSVLFRGGTNRDGKPVALLERYDPKLERFSPVDAAGESSLAANPRVTGSAPDGDARDVPLDAIVALRFDQVLQVETLNAATITLRGSDGPVSARIVGAEGGRLVFIQPLKPLRPETNYSVSIGTAANTAGVAIQSTIVSFKTGSRLSDEAASRQAQEAQERTEIALIAASAQASPESVEGVAIGANEAALRGVVRTLYDSPLANVVIEVAGKRVKTNRDGRFLIRGLKPGRAEIFIDARPANYGHRHYGTFLVGAELVTGIITDYPQVMWMPEIDMAHAVPIHGTLKRELVVTNPGMPNFELRIPADTTIVDHYGKPVRSVSVTPVPYGKIPFAMVEGYPFKSYYTLQPGGAELSNGQGQLARVYYPNWNNDKPGTPFVFHFYEPEVGWEPYGEARVSKDRLQIVPGKGVGIYELTAAALSGDGLFGQPDPAPCTTPSDCTCPVLPPPNNSPKKPSAPPVKPKVNSPKDAGKPGCGDPVIASTGMFVHSETDFLIADTMPLQFSRTYVSGATSASGFSFGIGTRHSYDMYLWKATDWTRIGLSLPNRTNVFFNKTAGPPDLAAGTYENQEGPAEYYKLQLVPVYSVETNTQWLLTLKDGTTYRFANGGSLISVTDRYGNRTTLTYEGGGLTHVASPNGRWLHITYNGGNRIWTVADNAGRTWTYTYDASDRLATATDPESGVRHYTYDTSHRMLTFQDARNNVLVTNQYTNGRVTLQTYADSTTTQYAYTVDGSGKITRTDVTDQDGRIRRMDFNSSGYMTTDTFGLGLTEQQIFTFTRDPTTKFLTDVVDGLGRTTHYTYDTKGNIASATNKYGTAQAVTWNYTYEPAYNQIATITDPLSHTTTLTYDSLGSLIQTQDHLAHGSTFTYNSAGQLATVTDALSHTTTLGYTLGDLTSMTDSLSRTTQFTNDALGRQSSVRDPLGNLTLTDYDKLDRVKKVTDPLGNTVQFGYDPNGNLTSHTDQRNNVTQYTYDTMNRLLSRKDALLKTESYAYSAGGQLSRFTDRKGQVSGFTYDGLHRRISAGFGATVASPTAYTNTVTYSYDTANRLSGVVDSISGNITHTYDDRFDTLTQEVMPAGTVNYTYDNAGRRSTMQVVGQTQITYTFDNANRLTNVTQGAASVVIAYDNANRRSTLTLPNGVVVTYGLDNANQLTSLTYTKGAATVGTLNYGYDTAGRRTSVSGTLAAANLPTTVASATYDVNNRLTAWGGASLTYDDDGNILTEGGKTYSWNTRNQLASISGGATASFQYDSFGRRPSKTISATQTGFVFDGSNFIQEKSGASVTANLLTGLGVDEAYSRTQGATTSTVLADALGSTIALSDSAGTITTQYTYEGYGKTTQTGAANANAQQFTGRENDGTGLYYYRARYYHPTYGRFLAEDPIGLAGGPNVYAYVEGDPITKTDRSGLQSNYGWPWVMPPNYIPNMNPAAPSEGIISERRTAIENIRDSVVGVAVAGGVVGAIVGHAVAVGEAAGPIAAIVVSDAVASGAIAGLVTAGAGAVIVVGVGAAAYYGYQYLKRECIVP